jgi:hypothetical protein
MAGTIVRPAIKQAKRDLSGMRFNMVNLLTRSYATWVQYVKIGQAAIVVGRLPTDLS